MLVGGSHRCLPLQPHCPDISASFCTGGWDMALPAYLEKHCSAYPSCCQSSLALRQVSFIETCSGEMDCPTPLSFLVMCYPCPTKSLYPRPLGSGGDPCLVGINRTQKNAFLPTVVWTLSATVFFWIKLQHEFCHHQFENTTFISSKRKRLFKKLRYFCLYFDLQVS